MDNIEQKSSNNSAKDKANQTIAIEQSKHNSNKQKKSKARMYIVLLFILLVAIVGYIIYRGEYLEILEIGENYLSIFWQNVNYTILVENTGQLDAENVTILGAGKLLDDEELLNKIFENV